MIVIYHSADLDGLVSGALIKMKFPDAEMRGFDYGQLFEPEINGQPVIIADIAFPMEKMVQIAKGSNFQLTWIDHHISAINAYKEIVGDGEPFCTAVLDHEIAACEGTWNYLFPESPLPLAVKLIGEYDTWRNSDRQHWEEEVQPFQFGMRLYCNSIESFPVEVFDNENLVFQIMKDGRKILRFQSSVNELLCKRNAFEFTFEGLRAICLNGGGSNLDTLKSVYDEAKHELVIPFQFNGINWTVHLFSTKEYVDCSAIPKAKGGGGHRNAAGFQVNNIHKIFPFMKNGMTPGF